MLSPAHLVLLAAAAQRDDTLLPRPPRLAGAALARMEASLVKAGVAEPRPVRADQPHWRRDWADAPIGLRITATGLAVARGDPGPAAPHGSADHHDETVVEERAPAARRSFRPGSKLARLVALLSEADGATIEALASALAWQPHTVRAALTRLRQGGASQGPRPAQQAGVASGGGFTIATREEPGSKTVYRIEAAVEAGVAPVEAGDA